MTDSIPQPVWSQLRRSPSVQVVATALATALVLVVALGSYQWQRHRAALERAERDTRNATVLLAEHTARTMDAVEGALEAAARVSRDRETGRVSADRQILHQLLKSIQGPSPLFVGIALFDAFGNQLATSRAVDAPPISLASRDFFRAHGEQTIQRVHIAATSRSIRDDSPILSASIRLEDQDGNFAGIASAALNPAYFAEVYRRVDLAPSQGMGLFRDDGAYLARHPHAEQWIGTSIAQGSLFREHLPRADSGTFHSVSPLDHVPRISSFARVPGRPLVVTVSVSRADALAAFSRDAAGAGLLLTLVLLALGAGTALMVRQLRRREKLQADLAAANRMAIAARDEAQGASRAKSEFLSRMSHELRTPLNAVIGFAQMLTLNRERNLTGRQLESVQHIIGGGQHLLALVNEVLDLAGVEAGKLKLSIERVGLADAVAYVRDIMEPLAVKAEVSLEARSGTLTPDIRADELRLRQVLINLVSNAIKYNWAGGSVTITAMPAPAGNVRIAVADTGIGIAPERHKDIFVPFNRLGAEYTTVEGTGIGLALARRLVEAMGGTIGFTSEPGHGSTFWIELPAAVADEPGLAGDDAAAAPPMPRATAGGYQVLYVEDNPTNLRLVEHILATLPNVRMLGAPTPQLGLELARAHRPNVIVLDLNLPGISGFDVLARLKAMPETRDIPVMALSAAALPADIRRGLAAGFFRYLTKPLDVNAFLGAIDEALGLAVAGATSPRTATRD